MAVRIKTDIRRWLQELDKKYFLVMLGFSACSWNPSTRWCVWCWFPLALPDCTDSSNLCARREQFVLTGLLACAMFPVL